MLQHPVNCTDKAQHLTPYRAELVGILGALPAARIPEHHSCGQTASIPCTQSETPCTIQPRSGVYHRHKHLLEQIKTEVMTLEMEETTCSY
jgi:hypothetical protein